MRYWAGGGLSDMCRVRTKPDAEIVFEWSEWLGEGALTKIKLGFLVSMDAE